MNIKLKNEFIQVCICPGCIVVDDKNPQKSTQDKIDEFEQFMSKEFNVRTQYLEEIKTKPDCDREHKIVEGTGGRNDLFFAVHNDDIGQFAVPRLSMGIRWIEDVLAPTNYKCQIYPKRVFEYISWSVS